MSNKQRIGCYVDSDLGERFYNAVVAQRRSLSHVIEELIDRWLTEEEAHEWVWTEGDGRVLIKAPGDPYPQRESGPRPGGRPH